MGREESRGREGYIAREICVFGDWNELQLLKELISNVRYNIYMCEMCSHIVTLFFTT